MHAPRSVLRPIRLTLIVTAFLMAWAGSAEEPSSTAGQLRDLGLAQLENEHPDQAEATYRELLELRPRDPLGHGNLAIALLRQQKYDAALETIDEALALAPRQADLLAIRGEVLQWRGDLDAALKELDAAARADTDDPEILYSAYQLASTLDSPEAEAVAARTLDRLVKLRPENVVVLLQKGQHAIADDDRASATAVYLRIGELLWQAQPLAERALEMVTASLESGDGLSSARVPALRLENVLKVSPMFRESLRELKTGIQGIPLARFLDQPEIDEFGAPTEIRFVGRRLAETPTAGRGLVAGSFRDPAAEEDLQPSIARLRQDGKLEILEADGTKGWKVVEELDAAVEPGPVASQILAVDVDNDGWPDLVACGPGHCVAYRGSQEGFVAAPDQFGLGTAGAAALETVDFDIEGDLDLVSVGAAEGPAAELWRNALSGPLEAVGHRSFPETVARLKNTRAVFASDLDRDGDLDLAIGHGGGVSFLANLRQGGFEDRTDSTGLAETKAAADVVAADLDGDGRPELITALLGLRVWHNRGASPDETRFELTSPAGLPATGVFHRIVAFDADNDGRLDLAAAGPAGVGIWQQLADGGFQAIPTDGAPAASAFARANALEAADVDADGDLDLLVGSDEGLHWLENQGGSKNGWLRIRLRGLDKGSSKNNLFGVGSVVEVRNGNAYQFREARGDVVHLGLGSSAEAEVLRVVWTNGVPQNRLDVTKSQRIVEEQLLKGSCPFLYAWDGEGFRFVTDLLWGSPLGLPAGEGTWVPADPSELVRVDGLVSEDGIYRLRVTEELWEAAFFDKARLWVVDHPAGMEVASALRIVPGAAGTPEEVRALPRLRNVTSAIDGRGRDVTARVARRDDVYADGYGPSPYQGVAEEWTFTFDLGETPGGAIRLALDGWIFPADASLNLAVSQRSDYPYVPPRLEVETEDGWQELMPSFGPTAFGHPAGKTKTMVVDTPPLPRDARRLRLVTSLWLHWDRIAWMPLDEARAADALPSVIAQLEPNRSILHYRGFSQLVRQAPNAPHRFDYARVRIDSPWIDFPGGYTRYGDVGPLLTEVDDFSVVLAPGDEMILDFDAAHLAPPADGLVRTLFLESWGWDKDADRNTWQAPQVGPLPFHAMGSYPYPEGVSYPDSPEHERYVEEWQTRERGTPNR
ncbi:MAG: FG-GAP-like repeat-containing protein [Thermoanaerobaculia bacterium]|nr:FG-GAP-like repeat-containing protein [Thermoanaerobaculia bacterium]